MTDTQPVPAPAHAGWPVPAHRAGPGLPGAALDAARAAGWAVTTDPDGNTRAVSPNGDLGLAYQPEVYPGPLWVIGSTAFPAWAITAERDTPAEFIAALITTIASAAPLDMYRERA